jgi:cysteine-rich repeat protein
LQLSVCGDGTIGAALNFSDRLEYCDTNDKNLPQEIGICTRGCTFTADRKISTCGNRILEPGEECDDGNLNDLDGCSKTCLVELTTQASPLFKNTAAQQCGNGILEPYEQCDLGDKNGSADALCNSTCQIPSTNPNNATANPNDSNTQNPGPPPENTTQNPATTVSLLNRGLRQLHCQTAHTPQVFYYVLTVYLCQYRILNRLVRRKKNEP